jgi:hypothetical protein
LPIIPLDPQINSAKGNFARRGEVGGRDAADINPQLFFWQICLGTNSAFPSIEDSSRRVPNLQTKFRIERR